MTTDELDRRETIAAFKDAVNMAPKTLDDWLDTVESKEVGQKDDPGAESTGHASGRRIVAILHTKQADYTAADLAHMRTVTGYVRRHLAQRPDGDVTDTPWRHSLMNWGHDPKE